MMHLLPMLVLLGGPAFSDPAPDAPAAPTLPATTVDAPPEAAEPSVDQPRSPEVAPVDPAAAASAPPADADAPVEDTDVPAVAPEPADAPDTDAPDADTDAPDTDAPDTDAPHADPHTDAPHSWHGMERFVGPAAPFFEDPTPPPAEPDTSVTPSIPSLPPPPPLPRDLPFLPSLPLRGWRIGLLLAIATGLAWAMARGIDPIRDWLAPTGVLPTLASALQQLFRALALFFVFGVIAAIIPENLEPALPWLVLAGALALGWSVRDVTPDFIAGIVLAAERRVKPGQWIGTPEVSGVVEQVTLRVTWVRDATGRRVAVPNRMFLRGAVITDRGQWPSLEVVLRIPGEHPPSTVRRVVEDAVMVSPWSAPMPPDLVREEQEIGLWRVRARVLEGRFADRFEGALREHVEEVLKTGTGLREQVRRRSHEPEAPA